MLHAKQATGLWNEAKAVEGEQGYEGARAEALEPACAACAACLRPCHLELVAVLLTLRGDCFQLLTEGVSVLDTNLPAVMHADESVLGGGELLGEAFEERL